MGPPLNLADRVTAGVGVHPGDVIPGNQKLEWSWPFHKTLRRRHPRSIDASTYFFDYGSTGNWVRHGHEATRATNVWHSDDNYVLEPPWCTVLRASSLPSCGG